MDLVMMVIAIVVAGIAVIYMLGDIFVTARRKNKAEPKKSKKPKRKDRRGSAPHGDVLDAEFSQEDEPGYEVEELRAARAQQPRNRAERPVPAPPGEEDPREEAAKLAELRERDKRVQRYKKNNPDG